ncbi:Na+/H+ antiporter NhaC family protein [Candidatus Cetobacterium colombiensis]|uniref:Na+/H+ antiporter NhaC family protein n=1 Tax=Candidatus Cetobacterium colombiensis TaxID=3073100 RepID=A0ABU4WAR7_9FUSO|nr:Na+/H+ antiporter NhaC family protein [Candidatus Cetobacterium colombiensis]MDX8336626.1 Na+/H+ antiporter NhaC family protein [Candidatus Cetobacterium colombiensis]
MKKIIELLKLSPVIILAMLMFLGYDALIAAPLATVYAAIIARTVEKKKINNIIEAVINNAKEMQVAFFILMVAYAMAEVFMSTGVGASIINLALNVGLTGRTVAVVGIIITSILSIATGTSWGTFAACAPIFLWLNHIVGGNIALTIGAIAGGSCFGDNIGLISDTTIVSSGIQKVEVIKRIRHQGYWSGLVLILGIICFYLAGIIMDLPITTGDAATAIGKIPQEVWTVLAEKRESAVTLLNQVKTGVPVYMIVPLILVLIAAFRGLTTLLCLFIGIFAAYILGMIAGTVENTASFLNLLYTGFQGAGSWVIVMMMWIAAFGGIMKLMDAFRPLSNIVISISKNVRQLMFYNGVLSILGNAALADEMAQIVTMGPIIKEIVENNVDGSPQDIETLRLRNATLSDALGVFGSQLIPWHVYIGFYLGIIQAVYPIYKFTAMDIIKYNFLALIAVSTILIATLTGLDRFIPRFGLPREPEVKLKKYTTKNNIE